MKITTSITENGIVLLEVEGGVDAHTALLLRRTLTDLLAQGYSRLVLDVSRMEYISSAGLRVLLDARREARRLDGEVRLFDPNALVRRVIELAGFEELLYVSGTRQQAMEDW
jgi:anti-sigma B factor antagonist